MTNNIKSSTTHDKNRKKRGRKRRTRNANGIRRTTYAAQSIPPAEIVAELERLIRGERS